MDVPIACAVPIPLFRSCSQNRYRNGPGRAVEQDEQQLEERSGIGVALAVGERNGIGAG